MSAKKSTKPSPAPEAEAKPNEGEIKAGASVRNKLTDRVGVVIGVAGSLVKVQISHVRKAPAKSVTTAALWSARELEVVD